MNTSKKTKVLFISYDFPPRGGGGVMRNLKFVKYLPEFNCIPFVLSLKNQNKMMSDESLLSEIPDSARVYRVNNLFPDSLYKSYRKHVLTTKLQTSVQQKESSLIKKRVKQIFSFFENAFLIPDNKIAWIPVAIIKAVQIIRKNKINTLIVSTPPHSTLLIGYFIKKITSVKCILDYRDEWNGNPYFKPKYRIREKFEAFLEKLIINSSEFIIANTFISYKRFVNRYSGIDEKIKVITNGYDEQDYQINTPLSISDKVFKISYVGSISMKRTPTSIFSALSLLFKQHPEIREKLEMEFVGPFYNVHRQQIVDYRIERNVKIVGNVSHKESVRRMVDTHCLLLLLHRDENPFGQVPGKTYEYLRAMRPIIAVVPGKSKTSAISDLIREYSPDSKIVDLDNVEQIKDAIYSVYENRNSESKPIKDIDKFERKYLTLQLVQTINKVQTFRE